MDDKTEYQINVRENDGYIMGEYYFRLTKEELDIIKWFIEEVELENNISINEIKENYFSERK